jgi:hypothetical protein
LPVCGPSIPGGARSGFVLPSSFGSGTAHRELEEELDVEAVDAGLLFAASFLQSDWRACCVAERDASMSKPAVQKTIV